MAALRAIPLILCLCALGTLASPAIGEPLVINASVSAMQGGEPFHLGTTRNPDGQDFTADHVSLLLDGKPWMGAMGEFHFSRYPANEWREELLKMKAGGIDIVATYVFWIHHEEIEGQFDWTGNKNLREFVSLAGDVGMKVFIRCGPWAHGECRNGGFPDWMMHKGFKLRSDDPGYIAEVTRFYEQIGKQLHGELWKDGGPVIGIQVENEFGGSPEYMLHLKQIARDAGLDVPLYTRTDWPPSRKPYPPDSLLPMSGAYPVGFWDRSVAPVVGKYGNAYLFFHARIDSEIGNDQLGARREIEPAGNVQSYPYLCCEMGGGMETSYHRRIHIDPRDIYGLALVKLGSGANLLGYYMYHGGTNPDGRLTTLQESQASGYPNDMPVKSYDFQAPLGEYGQIRPQYAMLRRLHLFLHDFGSELARMRCVLPELRPDRSTDTQTLRWSVRTDGDTGFLFVNNYQRLQPMPAKSDVQFELRLRDSTLRIPADPITIPADQSFFWPFNLDLGGIKLVFATAQPICRLVDGKMTYAVFAHIPGVKPQFAFDPKTSTVVRPATDPSPAAAEPLLRVRGADGRECVVIVLDESASMGCWKGTFAGHPTICLTRAGLTFDGDKLDLQAADPVALSVSMLPAPQTLAIDGQNNSGQPDRIFRRFFAQMPALAPLTVTTELVQKAGPPRQVSMGHGKVAEAPTDADFADAAVWRIKLPPDTATDRDLLLRFHYVGDVARLYLDGKLIDDNFYNGNTFDLGLRRFAPDVYHKELLLKVLPLKKDAPIYVPVEAMPKFDHGDSAVELNGIDVIENRTAQLVSSDAKLERIRLAP
jgi:beta-galactosidase